MQTVYRKTQGFITVEKHYLLDAAFKKKYGVTPTQYLRRFL